LPERFEDELVCAALREVFAKNSKLSLYCDSDYLLGDTEDTSWRKTLPFLRGKTLKSFVINLNGEAVEPHVATLCFDTVAMLEDNSSLERLDFHGHGTTTNITLSNVSKRIQR
jgi:hypothetical protein